MAMAASLLCRKGLVARTGAVVVANDLGKRNVGQRTSVAPFSGPRGGVSRKCFSSLDALQVKGLGIRRFAPVKVDRRRVISNVAAPLTFIPEPEAVELKEAPQEDGEFDSSRKPPFTLSDIRAAIPKHCWEKNSWKSMSYVARDVAIVFGLAAGAAAVNSWFVWPLYWLAQGTMFWALFVLGHDWYVLFLCTRTRLCNRETEEQWKPFATVELFISDRKVVGRPERLFTGPEI